MYIFYYDVLKKKYDDKIDLGYFDTDSLVIEVETEDIYEDFKEFNYYMDFSDYPKDHPNSDATNKKKSVWKFLVSDCDNKYYFALLVY